MPPRLKVFCRWFAALLLFFALANCAGCVRSMGLLPFRYTGFPFTFAAWGAGIEEFVDLQRLALNGLIALTTATLLATTLTLLRRR